MRKYLRKIALALGLGAAAIALPVVASNVLSPFTGPAGTNPINFPSVLGDLNTLINNINTVLNAAGIGTVNTALTTFHPEGLIYDTTVSSGTGTGTGVQTLGYYTLPANYFDQTGRRIRVHATFSFAATANSKSLACNYGNVTVISSGVDFMNGGAGTCDMLITALTTSGYEWATGMMSVASTGGSYNIWSSSEYFSGVVQEAWTAGIPIWVTGTDGTSAANDIILDDFAIEYQN